MFQGSIVALVTPMKIDGSLDKNALFDLLEWHIAAKTDAIVVTGTTGECPTLNEEEHYDIILSAVKHAAKRIPIIAGTGTNCTRHTLKLTLNAKRAGADAALIVTPYYNKPTQEGLFEHYRFIADQASFPIILYNVPGRTGCDLLPDTMARLAKIKTIIGIKDATANLSRAEEILKYCHQEFLLYSGEDETGLQLMLMGAKGVISVTANIAPEKMHLMCEAALSRNLTLAKKINQELMLLHQNLFLESNPIPTKWALSELKKISPGIRLPLTFFNKKYHEELRAAMRSAGVI